MLEFIIVRSTDDRLKKHTVIRDFSVHVSLTFMSFYRRVYEAVSEDEN